jgi:hypothetical protein
MDDAYFGFNVGQMVVSMLRLLKQRGILEEQEVLDLLWEAKGPAFPWSKQEIKELLKL